MIQTIREEGYRQKNHEGNGEKSKTPIDPKVKGNNTLDNKKELKSKKIQFNGQISDKSLDKCLNREIKKEPLNQVIEPKGQMSGHSNSFTIHIKLLL